MPASTLYNLARVNEINFGISFTKYIILLSINPSNYIYTTFLEMAFFLLNKTWDSVVSVNTLINT